LSSDRNHLIENADEAPGSETETFPNSPAALMRTLRTTTTRPQMPRLPRHLGHRACCDAEDEESMQWKPNFVSAASLFVNRLLIQVLHQFTGPKWLDGPRFMPA
jgi:hypothetical protein